MRIGLDLRMLGGGSGISRYISELSHQILKLDKKNQYVLFFNKLTVDLLKEYEHYGHKLVPTGIGHYSWEEQVKLPMILNKEKLDLVHFPHFNVPIFYTRPFVVTIHDLTHTKFPGKKKSHLLHRIAYNLTIFNAIKRAKKIIAVSEHTKKEILEFFKVKPDKIQVVYEGTKDLYTVMDKEEAFAQVANRFKLTKPFILYVGVWRRYKNLPMLVKAFDKLADAGLDFDLCLAGSPDPFYPEIEEQVKGLKHKDRLKLLGKVTDDELKFLYNSATLFVMPSLSEGFGLPPLEAISCGLPVAASDIPTLREVLSFAAEYFDPENLDNMADVIKNLLQNPGRLEELANAGLRRSAFFSWQKAGEETVNLYQISNDK